MEMEGIEKSDSFLLLLQVVQTIEHGIPVFLQPQRPPHPGFAAAENIVKY